MMSFEKSTKTVAWAIDFVRPSAAGVATRFYGHAGGLPTILLLYHHNSPALLALIQQVRDELHALFPAPIAWFGINRERPEDNQTWLLQSDTLAQPPFALFSDPDGSLCQHYGLSQTPDDGPSCVLVACDPGLRVLGIHECLDASASAGSIAMLYEGLDTSSPVTLTLQAPVMTQQHLLPPALCDHLIDQWQREHQETGVEQSSAGQRIDALNREAKRRRDHIVKDPALHAQLASTIGRCLMPAMRRSFAYEATRFEGFKIACYDDRDQGFFRAHRDNLSPKTAHRRFALSLLLNDDYEGGELRFPEYGPHRYRPPRAAGLVFSSSLLHEVLPVTQGQRFVLLSFLFGEAEARQRSAANKQPKEPS